MVEEDNRGEPDNEDDEEDNIGGDKDESTALSCVVCFIFLFPCASSPIIRSNRLRLFLPTMPIAIERVG